MHGREKQYHAPVETEPTPLRSDSYFSLMTPEVAKFVFARYDNNIRGTSHGLNENPSDIEIAIRDNPTLGTTAEKQIILAKTNQELVDFRIEEAYQLRKARMFYCCAISNVCGLTLTLYSLSLTVIFEQFDSNRTAFWCSMVFYLPAVVWFVYVFLPFKAERERRKKIHLAMKIRKHYKNVRQSYFMGHEDSDEEEFEQMQKEMEAKNRGKSSGSFSKDGRSSTINTSKVIPTNSNHHTSSHHGSGPGGVPMRVSIELPKAPARSSMKKVTGEKKASVQFKLDK